MKTNTTQLKKTAYHEAGHAVMYFLYWRRFRYVTINHKGNTRGIVRHSKLPKVNELLEYNMIVIAGVISEKLYTGRMNNVGANSDYQKIADSLFYYFGGQTDEELKLQGAYMKFLRMYATQLLKRHWDKVTCLAERLLECRKMTYWEVDALLFPRKKLNLEP